MSKITILNFSPRKDGNCGKISKFLFDYYKQTNVCSYSITAENYRPCGQCNYECLKQGLICPTKNQYQTQVMDAVMESDLVYLIIPDFCGYPCANYFAFNERSVGYFNLDRKRMDQYMGIQKRFIIISNTQSDVFREAMQQQVVNEPDILYMMTS